MFNYSLHTLLGILFLDDGWGKMRTLICRKWLLGGVGLLGDNRGHVTCSDSTMGWQKTSEG